MSLLAFRDVTAERGGRRLFENLSFTLATGGAIVLTGPNGAGKSSLIRIAAGLLRPANGAVERTARVALLAEATALDDDRTLADALGFWARIDGASANAVPAALERLALDMIASVPVRMLSTGQRRRAAMARVLIADCPLWLLDEPASGLDADAQRRLEDLIADHRAGGGAVLIATHQPLSIGGSQDLRL